MPLWVGGDSELLPYAVAGLVAWLLVRFFSSEPSREESGETATPEEAPGALGLLDDLERPITANAKAVRDREDERPTTPTSDQPRLPPGLLDW